MVALPVTFDDQFASPSQWAVMYREAGCQVVPARDKRPDVAWEVLQDRLAPQETFDRWYGETGQHVFNREMGLITGEASGRLFIVDLDVKDGPSAMQWWAGLLAVHNNGQELQTPIQTTPSGGRHVFLRAPSWWTAPTIRTPLQVDIRGQGGFVKANPSPGYDALAGHEFWSVEVIEAPVWVIEAVNALRSEHSRGHRIERTPSTTDSTPLGVLQDGREQLMRDIVWAVWCDIRRAHPEDGATVPIPEIEAEHARAWAKYELAVKSRIPDDGTSNADRLEREGRGLSAFNEKWATAAAQWDTKLQEEAKQPRPQFEAPGPVWNPWAQSITPLFPFAVLPSHIAEYVDYIAISIGCDPSAVAMMVLATAGGALTQESRVKMRMSGSFAVPPRLWLNLFGDPSTKKSPLIRAVTHPIRQFEETAHKQWKRDFAQWKRDGEDAGGEPKEPAQIMFKDTTVEAVAMELARHDRGAVVIFDELASLIGGLDKYGQGRAAYERGFWNEAYNGGWFRQNRATRIKIDIPNLCVGMIGAMQPERIGEVAHLTTDGLLQRFCPVMMQAGRRGQEMASDGPLEAWDRQLALLLSMQRQTYLLSAMGRDVLTAVEDDVSEIMGREELPGGFRGWAGKLPGVLGSLALVLHVLGSDDPLYDVEVGDGPSSGALAILKFLTGHAGAFYDSGGDPQGLREIASYLLTSDKQRFLTSDIKKNLRSWRLLERREFVNRMSVLVGWDVVTETGTPSIPAWEINPAWRAGLAQQREIERTRRAVQRQSLNLLRGSRAEDEE